MEKAVAVFTILGAIAAIVAAFQQGCWHYGPTDSPPAQVEVLKPPEPESSMPVERVDSALPGRRQVQDQETAAVGGVEPDVSTDRQVFDPLEFTLSNGEQTVLLSGQASVGVEFNQVGEMDFVTVRINSPGKEPEIHAALSTGARFDLTVGGQEYYVSMLSVDRETHRVKLRVDRR